jgi:hypothetical protein
LLHSVGDRQQSENCEDKKKYSFNLLAPGFGLDRFPERVSSDGAALFISGGVKTGSSKIRESCGRFFRLASGIVFMRSGGLLLPVSTVRRLLHRPLPGTKGFSPSGFRWPRKHRKKFRRPACRLLPLLVRTACVEGRIFQLWTVTRG